MLDWNLKSDFIGANILAIYLHFSFEGANVIIIKFFLNLSIRQFY